DVGGLEVTAANGDRKSVHDVSQIADTDRVWIGNIEMTYAQAKSMGYHLDQEDIPAPASANDPAEGDDTEDAPRFDPNDPKNTTTHEEVVAGLNAADAVAMHVGLDHEASAELAADMLTGEIASNDVLFDQMAERGLPKDAAYA